MLLMQKQTFKFSKMYKTSTKYTYAILSLIFCEGKARLFFWVKIKPSVKPFQALFAAFEVFFM